MVVIGGGAAAPLCFSGCSFLEFFNEKRKLDSREKKLLFRFFAGSGRVSCFVVGGGIVFVGDDGEPLDPNVGLGMVSLFATALVLVVV